VSGVTIQNANSNSSMPSGSAAPAGTKGAASALIPTFGGSVVAALLAWGLL